MATEKLTESLLKKAAKDRPGTDIWDSELKNFGVHIAKDGSWNYRIRYRPHPGGRGIAQKLFVFDAENLSDARKRAKKLFSDISNGLDPQEEKLGLRNEPTFAELCEKYLAEKILKPETLRCYKSKIKVHILPVLEKKKVSQILRVDCQNIVDSLLREKKIGTANQVSKILKSIFTFATDKEILKENPASLLKDPKVQRRDHRISDEEYHAIFSELKNVNPLIRNQIIVLACTMARKSEIKNLKWSEVHLDSRQLTLEDSKTGRRNIPLNEVSISILDSMERKGTYVFSEDGEKPITTLEQTWQKIKKNAGLRADLVIHNFRVMDSHFLLIAM